MRLARFLLVPVIVIVAACSPKPETDAELVKRAGAPLFTGMGEFHRVIDTKDAGAQRYFDQGMVLAFGFNHAEAIRSSAPRRSWMRLAPCVSGAKRWRRART